VDVSQRIAGKPTRWASAAGLAPPTSLTGVTSHQPQPSGLVAPLFRSNRVKRAANLLYTDVLAFARVITDALAEPLRNVVMRRVFTRSEPDAFFGRRVYVKFLCLVEIGRGTSINRGVEFYPDLDGGHRVRIGRGCYIAPNVSFHVAGHDLDDLTAHTGGDIVVGAVVWVVAGGVRGDERRRTRGDRRRCAGALDPAARRRDHTRCRTMSGRRPCGRHHPAQ
jgi:hypothetical protein